MMLGHTQRHMRTHAHTHKPPPVRGSCSNVKGTTHFLFRFIKSGLLYLTPKLPCHVGRPRVKLKKDYISWNEMTVNSTLLHRPRRVQEEYPSPSIRFSCNETQFAISKVTVVKGIALKWITKESWVLLVCLWSRRCGEAATCSSCICHHDH